MRITLDLSEAALRAAQEFARSRSISLDDAASELILEATRSGPALTFDRGIPVFNVPPGSRPITLEDVKRAEEELW